MLEIIEAYAVVYYQPDLQERFSIEKKTYKPAMCLKGLSYLPVITIILTLGTFILSYILAVLKKDVNAYFPYISDTGTKVPESCVFGQLLNMASAISICTLYVRYKLVKSIVQPEDDSILKLNKHAFFWGILSPLGLSLVANFQETSVEIVHVIGATMVLGFGVVYEFLQTAISFRMHPSYNGLRICKVRLVISIISVIGFLTSTTSAVVSRIQGHPEDKLHWKPTDGGFAAHITSTISEWVTALAFIGFFFTFISDFRKLNINVEAQLQVRHLDEHYVPYDDVNEESRLLV